MKLTNYINDFQNEFELKFDTVQVLKAVTPQAVHRVRDVP